jgi:hypothetical protein
MERIRLGGIKITDERSQLVMSCATSESALAEICARFTAQQINLAHLTYLADSGKGSSLTSLCTDKADGYSSYVLLKSGPGQDAAPELREGLHILSIFPHDQRPAVAGTLLELLERAAVLPCGLASSPSAMSLLSPCRHTVRIIDGLFDAFEFPAYATPLDWQAAYQRREQLLREVHCAYQEQVVKVYNIGQQLDLDLWRLALTLPQLAGLGAAFLALDRLGMRMPFVIAQPGTGQALLVACCFASAHRQPVKQVLALYLPGTNPVCRQKVAALFLVGPHFGDRYGITSVLLGALNRVAVQPLAVGCAVSSISLVIRAEDRERTMDALRTHFQMPSPTVVK